MRGITWPVAPGLLLILYGILAASYLTAVSWPQPILDAFSFRQTQTALSAYWILRGGPVLDYQTPVLGFPWSIPFEFPLYQWMVAKLAGALGLSIDHAGRVVSMLFFMGSAAMIYLTSMAIKRERSLALLCASAFAASPLVLFWSRAVMIESTALFFSLIFVWSIAEYVRRPSGRWAALAVISAVLAALVKVTTFFGFAILVCCSLIWLLLKERGSPGFFGRNFRIAIVSALAVLMSLACLKIWLIEADALKAQTLWGASLASSTLGTWNYGTFAQRMDPAFWSGVVFGRTLRDGFGSSLLFMAASAFVLTDRRTRAAGIILLLGYIAPFLTFTNLHFVHDYYQYANIACATTIVGLAIWLLTQIQVPYRQYLAQAAVLTICVLSWQYMRNHFVPLIHQEMANGRTMKLARHIRETTQPDSALLVLGLDWAADLPYYAERRALMMPDWLPAEDFSEALDQKRAFGDIKVGALVVCPSSIGNDPQKLERAKKLIDEYSRGRHRSLISGCEVFD